MKIFVTVLVLLTLVVGNATTFVLVEGPTLAPWVDPIQIKGNLLISVETRAGTGVQIWGTITDPDMDPLDTTITGVDGSVLIVDPNGAYTWTWHPATSQVGVHYVIMNTIERDMGQGLRLTDTATFAVKVLPANQPPVITYGGCRLLNP